MVSQAAPLRPLAEKAHVKQHNDVEPKTGYRRGIRLAQKSWAEMRGVPGPQLAGQILKDAAGPCCPPHIPTRCPKESRDQGLEGKPGRVHALPAPRSTPYEAWAGRCPGGRAPCKQHPASSRPTPGALRDGAALGAHPVDPGCSPSSRGCRKIFPGIKKKTKNKKMCRPERDGAKRSADSSLPVENRCWA